MTDSNFTTEVSDDTPTQRKIFAGRTLSDGKKLFWWREILIVIVVDVVYETIRNLSAGKPDKAYENALLIIDWQRNFGIWHEQAVQNFALNYTPLIVFANYFYGSVYIAATLFTLVFLYSETHLPSEHCADSSALPCSHSCHRAYLMTRFSSTE